MRFMVILLVIFLAAVNNYQRDFPGGPVVTTLPSSARDAGLIPGWGAKIPHGSWPKNQNIGLPWWRSG